MFFWSSCFESFSALLETRLRVLTASSEISFEVWLSERGGNVATRILFFLVGFVWIVASCFADMVDGFGGRILMTVDE